MRIIRKTLLPVISFVLLFAWVVGANPVRADVPAGTKTDTVYFGNGFFCLHPDRTQQGAYDKVMMEAVPAENYEGYPKETLDQFAAYIMLQMDYYYATGGENGGVVINNDDIQALIWHKVCTNGDHMKLDFHLAYGNTDPDHTSTEMVQALKNKRRAYLAYVAEHMSEVAGNYTMTIWVSENPKYQDLLELRLLEKHGTPTMEKKVLDKNDTDNTFDEAIGWQDGADYDIGDEVPFQLTATLSDMPSFDSYYLEFVDHMEHLELVEDSLTVTLNGNDVTDSFTVTKETADSATDLSVVCDNILPLKVNKGDKIVLSYSAILMDDAVVGDGGNKNEAYLVYTRSSGSADKGTTTPDKVKVFTYRLTVNKTDPEAQKLEGAAFKLSKLLQDGTYQTVAVLGATENADGTYTPAKETMSTFVWNGIDDGTYKLEEVITPVGYNTMKPIDFWVKAEHDHKAEDPYLYYLNSNYDGFDEFFLVDDVEAIDPDMHLQTEGYIAMHDGDMTANIENKPGAVLPSTGGMGTRIFYILGFVMVFSAGVLLVTKRRVHA